jgi:hypothetical protein
VRFSLAVQPRLTLLCSNGGRVSAVPLLCSNRIDVPAADALKRLHLRDQRVELWQGANEFHSRAAALAIGMNRPIRRHGSSSLWPRQFTRRLPLSWKASRHEVYDSDLGIDTTGLWKAGSSARLPSARSLRNSRGHDPLPAMTSGRNFQMLNTCIDQGAHRLHRENQVSTGQRLANDIRESNANIRARMARKDAINGGPGRTQIKVSIQDCSSKVRA